MMNDCWDKEFRRGRLAADDILALNALKSTRDEQATSG